MKFENGTTIKPTFRKTNINTTFITALKTFKDRGNLVYEYNPFKNFRLKYDLYKQDSLGRLINEFGKPIIFKYNNKEITLTSNNIYNLIETNVFNLDITKVNLEDSDSVTEALQMLGLELIVIARSGTLIDLETSKLKFDLNHPVSIDCQPSYDGSVNLIINDDKNSPRLINNRFIPLEGNTFKVANRKGNNDTNIYDDESFDVDSSLYKRITSIPKLDFLGVSNGGNMKCGNYNFYFKYADADGNETDFVAESGTVVCYVGNINSPESIRGGIRDESSYKMVKFALTNVDTNYDYVTVYYTRNTSDLDGLPLVTAAKIQRNFSVNNKGVCSIIITGFEPVEDKTLEDINVQYNIVNASKTQAQVQNMLFMGNVHKPEIPYEELQDLSLRIYPTAHISEEIIGNVNFEYRDPDTQGFEYYDPVNIYEKVSYWDNEIYRFGIVYILNDFTLSPVFNIRGRNNVEICDNGEQLAKNYSLYPVYTEEINYITGEKIRNILEVNEDYSIGTNDLENSKGVVRFTLKDKNKYIYSNKGTTPLGVKFIMPEDTIKELKKYCKGYFIVRQKRIPTILAQTLSIGLDRHSFVPLIPIKDDSSEDASYITERFIRDDEILEHDFTKHLFRQTLSNVGIKASICPEAILKSTLFTQLFTGTNFNISESKIQPTENKFYPDGTTEGRSFFIHSYTTTNTSAGEVIEDVKFTMVEDSIKLKTSGTQKYSAKAGEAEEAWRLNYLYKDKNGNAKIRGLWSTYLGMENYNIPMKLLNIHIPGYSLSLMPEYFKIRYDDVSPYYPIMHRSSIEDLSENYFTVNELGGNIDRPSKYRELIAYGGDCYVCTYTHRMMRNFQDPESPTNDVIVETDTFKKHYKANDAESNGNINRSDVNAVQLGHWVTFKCLSNVNLGLRDIDNSYYTEEGLTGISRGFYPLHAKSVAGNYKIPESTIINGGISSNTSEKYNLILPDVPYIKNEFDTRIMYSDIHINDAFKNGYRVFKSTNFRDYTKEFGAITKMISWFGNIICVHEHGVTIIPVNERALAAEGPGGPAFINTANVLPMNPKILSSNFGSGWIDSIIETEHWVYGIDTVSKKIWRTNGEGFEVISDFKIQKFLNDYITLKERELTPTIGTRNVKTHYNAFKKDVMFTFYDNLYGEEENVWNICYNEIMDKWITFYSWVPSASENIDNMYFSFDRTTSKWISKLGLSNKQSTSADGICISNVIFEEDSKFIGELDIVNRNLPELAGRSGIIKNFKLLEDSFGNYKKFTIKSRILKNVQVGWDDFGKPLRKDIEVFDQLYYNGDYEDYKYYEESLNGNVVKHGKKVYMLSIKAEIDILLYDSKDKDIQQFTEGFKTYTTLNNGYFTNTVAVTPYSNINNNQITEDGKFYPGLTTDFWKHGQAGLMDIKDKILPTKWYGEVHPFEFEFIVTDNPSIQKIFNNLHIISNKVAPESFHFEVVGEGYVFSEDKKNMYYRQELTKEMFQSQLYYDVIYNRKFRNIKDLKQQSKSNLLPLYYSRVDTFNEIYDTYQRMTSIGRDYQNLTGGEIVWDPQLNEFKVLTHQKASDIKKEGRLRGNMHYKEDIWDVEIKPINFVSKNEPKSDDWVKNIPIIVSHIPHYISPENPNGFNQLVTPYKYKSEEHRVSLLNTDKWTTRKEARLRDKYIKIKVRYDGNDLAVITALKTIFTYSYA